VSRGIKVGNRICFALMMALMMESMLIALYVDGSSVA
jgi:hypothetical protein